MAEQLSMDDILGTDKVPEASAPAAAPVEAAATGESPKPTEESSVTPPTKNPDNIRAQLREKEAAAQAEGRARNSDGTFAPKTEAAPAQAAAPVPEKPAAPAEPEMSAKEKAYFAAARDERAKRQALEQELAKLRQAPVQQAPAAPAEDPKQFWDDPEGQMNKFRQEMQQATLNTKLNTAEMIARSTRPDFDEKLAVFSEVLQTAPGLAQQWLSAPDPAVFAYNTGKAHLELKAAGSLDGMRAKIEAETAAKVEAKIRAEYEAKAAADAAQRAAIPGSLSNVRSLGTAAAQQYNGPTPMDAILKH